MNPRDTDFEWMASNFPELKYLPKDRMIVGELRFCAAFDRDSGQLKLGDTDEHRTFGTFLCDSFKVKLGLECVGSNGWPKVYEVGGGVSILQSKTNALWLTCISLRTGLVAWALNSHRREI